MRREMRFQHIYDHGQRNQQAGKSEFPFGVELAQGELGRMHGEVCKQVTYDKRTENSENNVDADPIGD